MKEVIKKMQALAVGAAGGKSDAFRLWKRRVIEFERRRRDRVEKERQEWLILLGEDLAKLTMPYATAKKQVDLSIQIKKFTTPNYVKITIEIMTNAKKQDDTIRS